MSEVGGRSQGEVLEDDPVTQLLVDDWGEKLTERLESLALRPIRGVAVAQGQMHLVWDDVVRHTAVHANRLQGLAELTACDHRAALHEAVHELEQTSEPVNGVQPHPGPRRVRPLAPEAYSDAQHALTAGFDDGGGGLGQHRRVRDKNAGIGGLDLEQARVALLDLLARTYQT